MKKFKKLIPAMCMLLVSAVMLGSSTFAWFSMNNKVTATGMEVTAKANTQYFVISKSTTFANDSIDVDLAKTTKDKVFPVSYLKDAAAVSTLNGKIDGDKKYTNTEDAPAIGDWYTANSKEYDVSADKLANVQRIGKNAAAFSSTDYFAKYTFYVGLAEKSSDYTGKLTVSVTYTEKPHDSMNAVIVINGKASSEATASDEIVSNYIFSEIGMKKTSAGDYYLSADGTKSYVRVDVYVYIDGNDAGVIDSNLTALKGAFSVIVEGTNA